MTIETAREYLTSRSIKFIEVPMSHGRARFCFPRLNDNTNEAVWSPENPTVFQFMRVEFIGRGIPVIRQTDTETVTLS